MEENPALPIEVMMMMKIPQVKFSLPQEEQKERYANLFFLVGKARRRKGKKRRRKFFVENSNPIGFGCGNSFDGESQGGYYDWVVVRKRKKKSSL